MEFFQLKKRSLITCFISLLLSNLSFSQVILDAVGQGTYTVPANVCAIYVEVIGAGGGGGYASDKGQATGGGGGGAYAAKIISVSPNQIINYFIGSGGSGTSGANNGGDTWFYSTSTLLAQGGRGTSNNSTSSGAGGAASSSIGEVRFTGGNGGTGSGNGECHAGGGGGSSAGPAGSGNNGANAQQGNSWAACLGKTAGVGGQPVTGSWNSGVGGLGATNPTGGQGREGNTGSGYGSGGGGAKRGTVGGFTSYYVAQNGGNGTGGAIQITVYYKPTVNISGLTALCEGSSTTLTASSNQSVAYSWSGGGTGATKIVTPTSTASYSVTATNATSGCAITTTHTINVTPKWNEPASISGAGDFCIGNTVNLEVQGGTIGASYDWFENTCAGSSLNSTSSYTFSPTSTKTFYVRASAHGACPASDCVPVSIYVEPAGNNLSNHLDESSCPVRDNSWVHFYRDGRLLLSVNSFGQDLGKVRTVSYVDPTSQLVPACGQEDNEEYSTSVMNRHWAIYPETEPTLPIQIRLPFYTSDLSDLVNSSQANSNAMDNVETIGGVILSKYHGPNNVNGDFMDNCPDAGGNGGISSHGQAGSGLVASYASIANAQYIQFTVNELSELWLHGSDKLSPLGILVDQINVECAAFPIITFRADRVSNVERIEVTGSVDGENWFVVGTIPYFNLSDGGPHILSVNDTSGENYKYYSIEAFDFVNESIERKIVVSNCSHSINDLQLYPNPSTGEIVLAWSSESTDATLVLMSVEGKVVECMPIHQKQMISLHHIAKGTYWVQVVLPNGEASLQRLILQ